MLGLDQLEIKVEGRSLFSTDNVHFENGMVALVGRNGAGKSTLLRSIMGVHSNYSGEISLHNKALKDYSRQELAKVIAMVYSKSDLFGKHSGREVIELGRIPYQNMLARLTDSDTKKIVEIVELLGIEHFVDRAFSKLSDGEKQLIMIGRAMAQDTSIILLDEPGAFLDLVNRHQLMKVLKQIAEKTNRLIIFSTHEVGFLEEFCLSVMLIGQSKLKVLKNPKEYLPTIFESFGIEKR